MMKNKILAFTLAFTLGLIIAVCGGVVAQSITTLSADLIIANTSLTSPAATISAITAHGPGNVVSNTALGNSVFNAATTGAGNVGIGSFALQNITTDQQNTAVGVDAFNGCVNSCAYGTAVGWGAGQTQLNGYGTFIGYLAGQGITTGTYNTIVGTSAFNTGSGIVGGSGNTILGAQVTGLAAGLTNNIILANGTGAIHLQNDGFTWGTGDEVLLTPTGGKTIVGARASDALTIRDSVGGATNITQIGMGLNGTYMPVALYSKNVLTTGNTSATFNIAARGVDTDTAPPLITTFSSTGQTTIGHVQPTGGASPTIANGACGAGANGSIAGIDQSGKITIGAAATTACAVVFGTAFTTAPAACTFSPASAASAAVTVLPYISAIGTGGFTLSGSVLATTSWYYHCF